MNSALKPVGVSPPSVPQQLSKPILQQNAPSTYGQPMSHVPQNLVNLPHSTLTPANAHSNNVHSSNHYPVNASNTSQQYAKGGNVPPPSNHPVASVNQSTPTKNITYSSNTNNVAHSYKIPVPTTVNSPTSATRNVVSEDPIPERLQSNGTPAEKPQQESTQNHEAEVDPSIKDKPQIEVDVPEALTATAEQPIETSLSNDMPVEKSVEVGVPLPALPVQQTAPSAEAVETTTTETILSSKPVDLPETITPIIVSVVSEPIVAPAPSIEPKVVPVVTTTAATDIEIPLEIEKEKVVETVTSPPLAEAVKLSNVKPVPTSSVNLPVNKPKEQATTKPTLKLATTQRSPVRKTKLPVPEITEQVKATKSEVKPPIQKSPSLVAKSKRTRIRTQPYQSPLPEVEMISKISASASTSKPKTSDDKLIVFYKNEFLAVRNPEGGFYICQAVHNIFKSTRKLRILWLSQDKNDSDIYTPDFYDQTDFDCILTNINLARIAKGKFKLPDKERIRTDSILKRALAVEKGDATPPCPTEEHPDGLDLSLYKEESQIKTRKAKKRKASPIKTRKTVETITSPDQAKLRRIEPKPKPPPVAKAVFIKKALAVKAKETVVVTVNKLVKTKLTDTEVVTVTKKSPVVDQKKAKVLAKLIKQPVVTPPALPSPSSSATGTKPLPPRKLSAKSTDTVVPFLRKEPPVLKKEAPLKKEYLVLKKESVLKKETPPKKEIPPKKSSDVSKKDVQMVRKEMPVLKKEVPIVKKDVVVQKQILTRKSNRGKK